MSTLLTKEFLDSVEHGVETVFRELVHAGSLGPGKLLVIGASTSEVLGARIGTGGSWDVGSPIFAGVTKVAVEFGLHLAFQCCEHLNRCLVVERETAERFGLEEVSVIPVPKAGGSMAAYAYRHLTSPAVVESVQAHGGIDIGSTLIGMHLKQVAVPVRPSVRNIGEAYVTMAFSRPKLVGGARAVYTHDAASESCK